MNPMYMVVGILIVWVIAFAVFMTLQMKRKNAEVQFVETNSTKAIVHFFGLYIIQSRVKCWIQS